MVVSLFAGSATDAGARWGVAAAVRRRSAVERMTPVSALAILVETPASASSVHAAVSARPACLPDPLSRKAIPSERVLFP